jgi:hypothetical protein
MKEEKTVPKPANLIYRGYDSAVSWQEFTNVAMSASSGSY